MLQKLLNAVPKLVKMKKSIQIWGKQLHFFYCHAV